MQVTVKEKKTGRQITFEYDIGEDLAGACALFGEETVWAAAKSELLTSVRDKVRPQLEVTEPAPISDEQILASLEGWKIGVRSIKVKDPMEKISKLFAALTDDQKAEVAKILKSRQG
jgi:hypothetical protein